MNQSNIIKFAFAIAIVILYVPLVQISLDTFFGTAKYPEYKSDCYIDYPYPEKLETENNATLENFKTLKTKIIETNSDLGIFFDGDADRSYFVDEKGEIVFADIILAILAKHELKQNPGQIIYYDLRFSKAVKESIKKNSGIPVMMRVGNPFYKEKLVNEGGILAGEFSGHIMFKSNYCLDDGLFAAVKLMSIISSTGKTLSELAEPLKEGYYVSEEINMKVKNTDETMKKIKEAFSDGESIELDGIYIQYPEWWFNLRKSNTEPVVRLRIEANSKELLEEKKKKLIEICKE